jgi:hypothetical protein
MGCDAEYFGGMVQTYMAKTPLQSDIYPEKTANFSKASVRTEYITGRQLQKTMSIKNRLSNIESLVYMH